jgi:hypothetical protein
MAVQTRRVVGSRGNPTLWFQALAWLVTVKLLWVKVQEIVVRKSGCLSTGLFCVSSGEREVCSIARSEWHHGDVTVIAGAQTSCRWHREDHCRH